MTLPIFIALAAWLHLEQDRRGRLIDEQGRRLRRKIAECSRQLGGSAR